MRWFYELLCGRFRAPWDLGPRKELVEVVESGRIQPCRAIDLGCGTASNAIFLAQHGFDVTGTDYSPAAIALCQQRGAAAGVTVNWIEDDLTELRHVRRPFDFLVDWGVYDDLSLPDRRAYLRNVLPLTHAHSRHFACHLMPQDQRHFGVRHFAIADSQIELIHRAGPHPHQHFARIRFGNGNILENQQPAELFDDQCFHGLLAISPHRPSAIFAVTPRRSRRR
ncbi:MAG: class I SAM-dependent methyltransferase [Chloroflexi bacterium]|nr:class I SAM-dependent methyltransferase [Chloroflexota bacterium]